MSYAWHFLRLVDGRPRLGNGAGAAPPVGEWLTVEPPIRICSRGLHASTRAIDALGFVSWKNAAACLVETEGDGEAHTDKFVCGRRRIVGIVPCDDVLRLFAREAALSVAHLWAMPPIVREYLETGADEIRAAALDAAWAAALAADLAARDAARDAAWAAARDAAWAARAAREAAGAAALAADLAADLAARDAARDAAGADLNALLESLLLGAMQQEGAGPS